MTDEMCAQRRCYNYALTSPDSIAVQIQDSTATVTGTVLLQRNGYRCTVTLRVPFYCIVTCTVLLYPSGYRFIVLLWVLFYMKVLCH